MKDTLQLTQEAIAEALKLIASKNQGFSETVILAIVAGVFAIATLITNAIILARAKKAEAKLDDVAVKIDGRLTQLLEISKLEAEERGHRAGKQEEKAEEKDRKINGDKPPPTIST